MMRNKTVIMAASCALSLIVTASTLRADDVEDAVDKARAWVELVDGGRYGESWDSASSLFKKAVTREQWDQALKGVRSPLGKLLSRKRIAARYETSLPGAPDGEYVIIQFQSSFERKRIAVETVTPMRDEDGSWRVSGYYIK